MTTCDDTPGVLSVSDIAEALQQLLPDTGRDVSRLYLIAELAIERAELVVRPVPYRARPVVLEIASRALQNPQAVTQETVGPFSRSFREPGVYVTDRERALLLALAPGCTSGAFTVRPGRPTS